jgi:ribonuclease HI
MKKNPCTTAGIFLKERDFLAPKKNYYAVKQGRKMGIFNSWAACREQVQGYPGALFKGFVTKEEAEAYLSPGESGSRQADSYAAIMHHIYVDGSYFDKRYSWGFAVYEAGQLIHTASGVGCCEEAAKLHNVAGEVEATIQAVKWAEAAKLTAVVICHDYIGVSEWAEGRWQANTPLTKAYKEFMADYIGWVRFSKVAGHTGVAGNELADKLAKKALGI